MCRLEKSDSGAVISGLYVVAWPGTSEWRNRRFGLGSFRRNHSGAIAEVWRRAMKGSRFHRGLVSIAAAALVLASVAVASPVEAAKKPPAPPPESTAAKVQFSSATFSRSEAGGLAVVSVKRSSKKGTASVAVSATDNTATAGADYGPWNGTSYTGLVTFAAGQTTKTLNVPIFQDGLFEGPEIVNLTLGPEVTNVQLGQIKQAELTIVDDEVATLSVADVAPVDEGEAAVYTVSLAVDAGTTGVVPVQVGWEVVHGEAAAADFTPPVSGQVAIPTDATSATFTVQTADDAFDEPDLESFTVRLAGASGGVGIADGTATGGIVDDDDTPLVTLGDAARVGEGGDLAFSVNLGAPSSRDVTAQLELWTPGAQYPAAAYAEAEDVVAPASLSVPIPAGATSVPFVVGTVDDALYEGDESLGLHLVGATNAALPPDDLGGASQADRWAYGTIADSELPEVCVLDAFEPNSPPLEFATPLAAGTYPSLTLCPDEGGWHPMSVAGDWYAVDLNAGDTIEATVDFLHAEGNILMGLADFTDPDEPGDLGYSDGTGDQEHIVAVAPFTRRYYLLVGLDVDAGTIPGNAYTLTLAVTPAPPTLSVTAPAAAVEGQDAVEFTVGLGPGVLPLGVMVYWDMTAGDDEVAVASGEVIVAAGSSTAVISLSPVDDEIYEIDSPLTVRLLETSGHEVNPAASTATVMLADDDPLVLTLSGPTEVAEGSTGTFTVHLDRLSEIDVPVDWMAAFETAVPEDVILASGVATVPAGTHSATFGIAAVDDADAEADETFTAVIWSFQPRVDRGDPYEVPVTIPANDAPPPSTFENNEGLVVNHYGAATPFPSTIEVSGLSGMISTVTATLTGLSHSFPDDLQILLVGPNGQNVMLLQNAGGTARVEGNFTFDDAAATAAPDALAMVPGTYRPSQYGSPSSSFPATSPYGSSFAAAGFAGTDANGTWSLYVFDDAEVDSGTISGWSISITMSAAPPT